MGRSAIFKFWLIGIICIHSAMSWAQDRPNILWLTFEDTSPQFIGCYGDENADTPVMDLMASKGVRFENAFSTGTVCSPSRSAIITGVPTYKMGSGNHRSAFPIPNFIKGFPEYLKDAGYYVTNNYKTDYNITEVKAFTDATWDESSGKAGWWNRDENQPFFSVFNIPDSHQSRTMSMSYEWYEKNVLEYLKPKEQEATKAIEDREYPIDELKLKKAYADLHEKYIIGDSAFVMPPIYKDSKEMRKQVARVYNSIKLTDLKMGNILQRLSDDELLEDTIVFIFADHGEGMPRAKTNGIGLGYRVPFIIWFPEKYAHLSPWGTGGVVTQDLIDFEDLAPSILDLAKVSKPDHLKGTSLFSETKNEKAYTYLSSDRADNGPDLVRTITDGDYVYSRIFMPFMPEVKYIRYIDIGAVTQQMREDYEQGKLNDVQKALFEEREIEVLYHLKEDPWEINNLVHHPEYQSKVDSLRKLLKKEIIARRDVHFLPEYELGELSKTTTAYEFRTDTTAYDLEQILATAFLVGKKDQHSIQEFLSCLVEPHSYNHYWAAIGLFTAKEALNKNQIKQLEKHLDNDYPPAQIYVAATLHHLDANSRATELMKKHLLSNNEHLALTALNLILYMDKNEVFKEQVQQVYQSQMPYKVKAAAEDYLALKGLLPSK